MLKPYDKRVKGTYELMRSMIQITDSQTSIIKDLRNQANRKYLTDRNYNLHFELDKENPSKREFKGYEGEKIQSEVTGLARLKYDPEKAFTKDVEYFNNFTVSKEIEIPRAYIIPQGWWQVLDRLKLNQIKMEPIDRDTTMQVEVYKIEDFETTDSAYEGHYLHSNTKVSKIVEKVKFRKGDLIVTTFQDGARYLLETLEPEAVDSFFNWNFFDSVLQQKEGFSPYVFEDKALEMLKNDPDLKKEFEDKKRTDTDFRNSSYAQLDWLHKQSENYEDSHLRYPIFRLPR